MNKKQRKPKPKAAKKGKTASQKAVTHRQQFQKDLKEFEVRVNEKLEAFRQGVNAAFERVAKNIQLLNGGIKQCEAHVSMIRRVFDDGLNGAIATAPVPLKIKSVEEGVEKVTEAEGKRVNWDHYVAQYLQEKAKEAAAKQAAIDASKAEAAKSGQQQAEAKPVVDDKPLDEVLHENVTEADRRLMPAEEAKKEEPAAPPQDDGIPDGAAVFGGD